MGYGPPRPNLGFWRQLRSESGIKLISDAVMSVSAIFADKVQVKPGLVVRVGEPEQSIRRSSQHDPHHGSFRCSHRHRIPRVVNHRRGARGLGYSHGDLEGKRFGHQRPNPQNRLQCLRNVVVHHAVQQFSEVGEPSGQGTRPGIPALEPTFGIGHRNGLIGEHPHPPAPVR